MKKLKRREESKIKKELEKFLGGIIKKNLLSNGLSTVKSIEKELGSFLDSWKIRTTKICTPSPI